MLVQLLHIKNSRFIYIYFEIEKYERKLKTHPKYIGVCVLL